MDSNLCAADTLKASCCGVPVRWSSSKPTGAARLAELNLGYGKQRLGCEADSMNGRYTYMYNRTGRCSGMRWIRVRLVCVVGSSVGQENYPGLMCWFKYVEEDGGDRRWD